LNIDVQNRDDHQVKLTVEVDAAMLDEAKQRAARQLSRQTKIPGFRPGKAPYNVVQRVIGEEAIQEEAIELLVKDVYPKVLDESGIKPYGPGTLENIKSTTPPIFEFIVPLQAEVELGDYQSVRIPYELKVITDQDVEDTIQSLREQQAVIEPVERPVQEGDLVYVKLTGQRGKPKEGEEATFIEERTLPVNVAKEGEDDSMEWPFSGFSRRLIGMSAGEEITFNYDYPKKTNFEAFKGIKALFKVTLDSVKRRTLPDLNDEFAQTVGDFPTLEALRTRLRENLKEQTDHDYNEQYDNQVLDKIIEISPIKYPPQMLEHEMDHVIERLKERLEQQKLDMELYLKSRQIDMKGLREEAKPVAESRIKRSLVLLEIADKLGVQVNSEDLQAETERTLSSFAQAMPEKEFRKIVSSKENTSS